MNEVANWENQTVDPTGIQSRGGNPIVTFYTKPVKNEAKTKMENRPVFEERIFIKIVVAGDKDLVIDTYVTEQYKERFPQAWERWERTRENLIPGIPIDSWHSVSETQKATFKALNILTVEQFATLPDSMAAKIMGFYDLRNKAKVFIEAGKDAELMGKLRAEMSAQMAKKDAELAELRAMVESMTALKKETAAV